MAARTGMAVALAAGILLAAALGCADTPEPGATAPPAPIRTEAAPRVRPTSEQTSPVPTIRAEAAPRVRPASEQASPVPRMTPVPAQTPASAEAAPPIPRVSVEYEGRQYQGKRGSYCWPVNANSIVCADAAWWEGFDEQSPILMKRKAGFEVVVSGDGPSPEQVRVEVLTVLDTGQRPRLGKSVFAVDSVEVPTLDVPPGVYFLSTFLKFELGDVSYGFKIEIAE